MAETETRLVASSQWPVVSGKQRTTDNGQRTSDARRWNDYGIGLLEQAQYGAAAEAFRRASELDTADTNLLVNAAIAEMRTERFAPERGQFRKAEALLNRALNLPPFAIRDPQSLWRARYFRALVWRADGKLMEAAEELKLVAREYPRDREVLRQLAHTFYTLGRLAEARAALEAVIAIDPTDAGAWQILAPIYLSEGRQAEAERARALYLQWRDDPRADGIAARFFAAHPEWTDERIGAHTHGAHSPNRSILTGKFASPDK
jgi:Flp pilus assembly protein TadD